MNYTDGMTRDQWLEWFLALPVIKQEIVMLLVDTLVDMGISTKDSCLIVYEAMVMLEAEQGTKH